MLLIFCQYCIITIRVLCASEQCLTNLHLTYNQPELPTYILVIRWAFAGSRAVVSATDYTSAFFECFECSLAQYGIVFPKMTAESFNHSEPLTPNQTPYPNPYLLGLTSRTRLLQLNEQI